MTTTRSQLFTAYNQTKAAARQAGQDTRRVDRALGLAERKDGSRPYTTSEYACTCPDFVYRGARAGQPCKHMTALKIRQQAERQAAKPEPAQDNQAQVDQILAELGF